MNATKPGSFTPFDSLTARNRSLGFLPEGHRFELFAAADLDRSIVARFERQVERWPERTAVCMDGQQISYTALNQQANRIAHMLRAAHAGEPAPVALLLAQSPLLIAAIMGVLKAGMFYMPLDPDDPPARLGAALAAPPAVLLLTDAAYADLAARVVGDTPPLLRADKAGDWPAENLGLDLSPDQLAYLFFTSGTTGKPKSVVDSHRNVLHNIMRYTNRLAIGPDDGLTLIQYSSFSGSVSNIFGALLNGATLFPYDIRRDGAEAIGAWLLREPITIYHSVPSIFRAFLAEGRRFERVRIVRLEGDQAAPRDLELFQRHFPPSCRLVNGLGATECGIVRQLFADHQTRIDGPTLPIGYPVEDMELLLLDGAGQPVAVGETGEIVIRSRYLAVGYWNSPEQTAAAFRDDPEPGFRRYHTGDLGRLHPDGCLEHLGRKTFQAKVLGHSLDLVEIEAALRRVTGVAEAAALVREDAGGEPRLVAYLVPVGAQPPLVTHIRQTLAGWLPDYAIPSAYVFLAALPLNANMKVDRRALPAPGHERPLLATPLALPRTPVEQRLAELWQAELGIAPVGVHDAFVELGGNSLSAARLLAAVRAAFGAELAPRSLFEPGTVAGLAALLDGEGAPVEVDAGGPQPVARGRDLPLSFAQQRFWLLDQIQPGNPAYLVPLLLDLEGPLDPAALQRALHALAARHEAFRTSFVHGDDQPLQRIAPAGGLPLEIQDLRDLPPAQREKAAGDLLRAVARAPFDLARGPLWRALLLRLEGERARLLIVGHHSVTDGISSGLIGRELGRLYAAGGDGLPAPALDYADYAVWQQDLPATPAFRRALEHWAARLANPPGPLDLPADTVRPATPSFAGGELRFTLAPALTAGLRALARAEGATLFMALLAALDALLLRYSGQTDMCVGTAVAERDRPELTEMVGCLLNTLALRVDLAGDPSFRALLGRVRATTLDAYAASVVPFEQARAAAQPAGGAPFQVMLVLQPAAPPLPAGPLRIAPLPLHNGTAKFDLTLTITEHPDRLECALEYSGDLFLPATAARLAGHFQTLLAGALAAPETRLSTLPLLGEAELRLLRDEHTATAAPGLPNGCLHELVAAQAARTPDAPALRFGSRTLSYRELDRRSNQLAQLLRRRGVGPETAVALCAERTPELVIGLLGILKAGGAYIPLDPHFPPERLALMLEDARPALVLTAGGATAPAGPWATLDLEADWPLVARAPDDAPPSHTDPNNLAYVIYTSGSTGRPKGVQISHAALVNFLRAMARQPGISPEDVVLLVTTLSFDIAALELFLPLTAGACLQIVPREVLLDGAALARTLREAGVTLMQATPATWRLLLEAGWEGEPR
ncbi:MAG TPA: AMP-binding protein, partial [Roseiflexaceae bacterium]|nr:AMP-binding protein [Roseiflexaceae bacterium]